MPKVDHAHSFVRLYECWQFHQLSIGWTIVSNMKKKIFATTFAIACGIGLSDMALAQSIQVQATNVNAQNTGFNLSIGKPEFVAGCMEGAKNIYNTWITNGASEAQASSALNDYWNNCNCAAGSKAHCL